MPSGDRLQHLILGVGGIAGHAHVGLRRFQPSYFARAHLAQNVSAVTATWALVRREAYIQIGGFDENLAVTFMTPIFACGCDKLGIGLYGPHMPS